MLNVALPSPGTPLTILCLGAHSDDIEIGCGGTVLSLAQQRPDARVHWTVFSADSRRADEARSSALRFLDGVAEKEVDVQSFRDGFFPYVGGDIKQYFEALKQRCTPDVIFTHYRDDRHQDHRVISDLTWNTFRDHFILEYEIPKYDGDLGAPNVFVALDKTVCQQKIRWVLDSFQSQANRRWFTDETFFALLRLRGVESASPSGYAEAFFCRKAVLGLAARD